jgi:hypothetical protein
LSQEPAIKSDDSISLSLSGVYGFQSGKKKKKQKTKTLELLAWKCGSGRNFVVFFVLYLLTIILLNHSFFCFLPWSFKCERERERERERVLLIQIIPTASEPKCKTTTPNIWVTKSFCSSQG